MPIANIELIMMALAAVLAAQHFPREVDNCEGLPVASHLWQAWKVAFCLAHFKRQCQLKALGGAKPLGGAHALIPTAAPTIDCIGKVLENFVLAASNDTTILQQLTVVNLALTALVTSLTPANKKLADMLARNKGGAAPTTPATPAVAPAPPKARLATRPFPGDHCWTHGQWSQSQSDPHKCNLHLQGAGTQGDATNANTMGGSKVEKGWNSCT